MAMAARPIHSLEAMEVAGPQNWNRGNWPKSRLKRSRNCGGWL